MSSAQWKVLGALVLAAPFVLFLALLLVTRSGRHICWIIAEPDYRSSRFRCHCLAPLQGPWASDGIGPWELGSLLARQAVCSDMLGGRE